MADSSPVEALTGGRCTNCGAHSYPFRFACRRCAAEMESVELTGRAQLQAWTVVRVAPRGFTAPYALGYAVMEEGPRVLIRIDADPESLQLGQPLRLAAAPAELATKGLVAEPLESEVSHA